ncbi:hypothetical protein PhCBS80983_g01536 [Powellomyces hirtus]|uniref:C2H2-type domain-containing protein n=1 Tax=Powellomyces hirtus TaxID=109895 RepID=A0A507EAL4_9FUNG|nr:hypothetical protein PhCBS80983_g01536 [Powellomyces hirtus]
MVRLATLLSVVAVSLALVAPATAFENAVSADHPIKCPVAGKCPYYEHAKDISNDKHGEEAKHAGCPLKDGGCPYYSQHKKDHTVEETLVTESGDCPLAKKCKWYQDIKDGKANEVDFSKTDCPLAGKCPYYDELKKNGTAGASDCPVLHACPHFTKKDLETQPHPHGQAHGHGHDAKKCPHLQAQKASHTHNEL